MRRVVEGRRHVWRSAWLFADGKRGLGAGGEWRGARRGVWPVWQFNVERAWSVVHACGFDLASGGEVQGLLVGDMGDEWRGTWRRARVLG